MISATRRWLRRNRNGIAITAGVVGATYLAGQYVLGKISEARERMNLDRIAKDNLKRRFEQNQTDCTFTVLALLPTVTENVLDALPVEQLTQELQQKKAERLARAAGDIAGSEISSGPSSLRDGDTASLSSFQASSFIRASQVAEDGPRPPSRRSKVQLWNEIKITSITRAFTLIYTLSLLTLLTRIQLNLLGRLNYLTSVITLSQPPLPERSNSISLEDHDDSNPATGASFGNDFETNRRYLTFSWFLLHRGYAHILAQVQEAVAEVFGSISPTEALTAAQVSDLCLAVRKKVEGSTEQERYATRWLPYLLPPRDEEEALLVESGVITPPAFSSSASSPNRPSDAGPHRDAPSYVDTSTGLLRHLLDETADLVDSPTFTRIHTMLLNTLFSHLIDVQVAKQAFPPTSSASALDSSPADLSSAVTVVPVQPPPAKAKLATILAVLTRQAHAIGQGNASQDAHLENEYLNAVNAEVKELESFAAVIYANKRNGDMDGLDGSWVALDGSGLKSAGGIGVSDVGTGSAIEQVDEMVESKLEGAWSRVVGSAFSSRYIDLDAVLTVPHMV